MFVRVCIDERVKLKTRQENCTHTTPANYTSTHPDENSYSNYLTPQLYITSTK